MKINHFPSFGTLLCLLMFLIPLALAACSSTSQVSSVDIIKETNAGPESRSITDPSENHKISKLLRSAHKQKGVVDIGQPNYRIVIHYVNQQDLSYSYYVSLDLKQTCDVYLKSPDSEHLYELSAEASKKIEKYLW